MKASHTIRPVFDDPNVVSDAGLVPALRLAESAGLHGLLEEQLSVSSPNATAKTAAVVGGMPRLFAGVWGLNVRLATISTGRRPDRLHQPTARSASAHRLALGPQLGESLHAVATGPPLTATN